MPWDTEERGEVRVSPKNLLTPLNSLDPMSLAREATASTFTFNASTCLRDIALVESVGRPGSSIESALSCSEEDGKGGKVEQEDGVFGRLTDPGNGPSLALVLSGETKGIECVGGCSGLLVSILTTIIASERQCLFLWGSEVSDKGKEESYCGNNGFSKNNWELFDGDLRSK